MVIYQSYGRVPDPTAADPTASRRDFSRVTGHHNAIDDDPTFPLHLDYSLAPPSYRTATLRGAHVGGLPSAADGRQQDSLPDYECTVEFEGPAGLKYEQSTPFNSLEDKDWADVYLKLHGTCLSVHQLGSHGKLSKALGAPKPDWPGRHIKTYTLQQAEAGLASDAPKHELIASTLAAALWPHSKIKRLQEESPQLFDHVRQYVIRLRLETEQLIIRFKKWEDRAQWIDHLCKAIDIASPLEYRTEPKYHTLPRRRRPRPARNGSQNPLTNMASLIEEQERIMRARFPHLLENNDELAEVPEDTTADPEAEDLDNTVVMVNSNSNGMQRANSTITANPLAQPYDSRQLMDRTFFLDPAFLYHPTARRGTDSERAPADPSTKLVPAEIDPNQALRWRRRCMPTLLYTSRRCDDIVFKDGKLWKIDWNAQTLNPYPEPPPRYEPPPPTTTINSILHTASNPASASASSSARPSESQSRALRPTPSTTTMDDSADSTLNTLDSNSNPSTSTTDTSNNRSSKLWGEMKGWGKRMRKTQSQDDAEQQQQQQRPNTGASNANANGDGQGLVLHMHKMGHEDANGESFGDDTLRILGIQ